MHVSAVDVDAEVQPAAVVNVPVALVDCSTCFPPRAGTTLPGAAAAPRLSP